MNRFHKGVRRIVDVSGVWASSGSNFAEHGSVTDYINHFAQVGGFGALLERLEQEGTGAAAMDIVQVLSCR